MSYTKNGKTITIIGDVHGKYDKYLHICNQHEYTVQVGDMGFSYDHLDKLSPEHHRFFPGNHDNYDIVHNYTHNLGGWGVRTVNGVRFFFIRGAFSIDMAYRQQYDAKHMTKSWWSEEELTLQQMYLCFDDYKRIKPDIVLAHSLPIQVSREVGNPSVLKMFGFDPETFQTNTQNLLQNCVDEHAPSLFCHGHFHFRYTRNINGTEYVGLEELGTFDVK